MSRLYLASQSPRRAELLTQIGVPFQQFSVDVIEQHQLGESAEQYVRRLAEDKARAGLRHCRAQNWPAGVVLGADTVVLCDGKILGKPQDFDDFAATLKLLSGRSHSVMSAVALFDGVQLMCSIASTEVTFRPLDDAEIACYWRTGEPQDKAGGYGIQGLAAVFVERIEGSYSNVVGLPLETLAPMLVRFAVPVWQAPQLKD